MLGLSAPDDAAQRHALRGHQTEVHSDGLGAFRAVIAAGHAHTVIESEGGRAATEAGGMRWVNTVLGNVNRRERHCRHVSCWHARST